MNTRHNPATMTVTQTATVLGISRSQHVTLDYFAVVRPCRQRQLGLDRVDPHHEEIPDGLLRRRNVCAVLEAGESVVQCGQRLALRCEIADLSLTALAVVVVTQVEAIAPRSSRRSGLAQRALDGATLVLRGHPVDT